MARGSQTIQAIWQERIMNRLLRYSPRDPKVKSTLYRIGALIEREAKLNVSRRGNRDTNLRVDTGTLLNSIRTRLEQNSTVSTVTVGSWGVKYAAIHEFGGRIKPKEGKRYLTIPLEKEFRKRRAKDVPGLFFFEAPSGEKFLARNEGGQLRLAYLLRSSVYIPARPYLKPALDNNKTKIFDLLRAIFRDDR